MKTRLLGGLVGLAISLALPIFAQQKEAVDPQIVAQIEASFKEGDKAFNNNDAAAVAAFYTEDAIFLTTRGPVYGRQAIEKWYANMFKAVHPKNYSFKTFQMIGTADNILSIGEWDETLHGKNGEAIQAKGYSSLLLVREGDGWKMRVDAWNATPDTVLLINKSFAPQPAATPSPTTTPSSQ
jgi:uncharacterized protein (TIGR02246 family)